MPTPINRDELDGLVAQGAQLVEVLPAEEYSEEHLPGAVTLPLRAITGTAVGVLDKDRPVIVYCWDAL
ncbi:MAG: hypothetical protein NVS3B21_19570 [Acidimicrobiales bacterium]